MMRFAKHFPFNHWNPGLDLFGSQKICPLGIGPCGSNQVKGSSPKDSHSPTSHRCELHSSTVQPSPLLAFLPQRKWGRDYDTPQIAPFFLGSTKATVNRQISPFLHLLTSTDSGTSDSVAVWKNISPQKVSDLLHA